MARARVVAARAALIAAVAMAMAIATPTGVVADEPDPSRTVRVAAAAPLIDSGLMAWLSPRFRFKTRITIESRQMSNAPSAEEMAAAAQSADLLIAPQGPATEGLGPSPTPIATRGDTTFVAVTLDPDRFAEARTAPATRLVGWLISDAGARAIARFDPPSGLAFGPPGAAPTTTAAIETGDHDEGEKLALQHCGRCHVISEKNKYGGIGSTPSFPALRTIPRWRDKFEAFWTLNPHPSFTQIAGVTTPFSPERPPHIAPIELTLPEAEAITAYAASIKPKDLGAPVKSQ